jgi:hypothetical protein
MLARDRSQIMHSFPVGEGRYILLSTTQAKQNPVDVQLAQLVTGHVGAGGIGAVATLHCPVELITYPTLHCRQILPDKVTVQFRHSVRVQVGVGVVL